MDGKDIRIKDFASLKNIIGKVHIQTTDWKGIFEITKVNKG